MAHFQMSEVVQHLRRATLRDGAGLSDEQLLEEYVRRRDGPAVAALVQRHGPMVWGVCRRVLGNYHDAEDAFQATFLVLVRRAASIASRELLANWLYGVAYQTALKARATAGRRRARERQVEMPEMEDLQGQGSGGKGRGSEIGGQEWRDLAALIDKELSLLPEKYRAVIVLCDLECKTRKEAAKQLGCPEGTVAGRLARARVLLAKRFTRHGLVMSGGAMAVILAQNAAAAVPTSVASNTVQAATLLGAGQAAVGMISAKAVALTEGVLKTMLLMKLKIGAALLAASIFTALAVALSCNLAASDQGGAGNEGRAPAKEKKADPAPAEAAEMRRTIPLEENVSRMRWSRDGKVMVSYSYREQKNDNNKVSLFTFRIWDGQTGKLRRSLGEAECPGFNTYELSRDGKLLAISQRGRIEDGDKIQLWDVAKGELMRTLEMAYERTRVWFAISPDNSIIAVCGCDIKGDKLHGTVRLFEVKTGKLRQRIVRDDISEIITVAFSPDGKLVAAGGYKGEVVVWELATGKAAMTGAASGSAAALAFSADAKQLISTGAESGLLLWDLATGKSRELRGESGGQEVAFSPDGRFVAAIGRVQRDGKEQWGLRVWNARTGALRHEWDCWRGFAFTPDSNRLSVLQGEKTIKILDVNGGE